MAIIAISNQKGGCGKTTTAINLSASLSSLDKKILLVDLDPQAHASLGLNIDVNNIPTIYDALSKFSKNKKNINEIIISINKNLFLAPSNMMLSTLEQEFANEIGRESRLGEILSAVKQKFDYVIIDCPPNLGILTINAIRACNELIIPLEASRFAIEGLRHLMDIVTVIKDKLSHKVGWRILITSFDSRLHYSHKLLNNIKNEFGKKLFDTIVHINVKLKEAAGEGKSVLDHDKYSRGAKDYLRLAKELLLLIPSQKTEAAFDQVVKKRTDEFIKAAFSLYAPDAKSVYVVGDFNNWSKENSIKLQRVDNGSWERRVGLKPGQYYYRFIVDDIWIPDPTNPRSRLNPFGEIDSLLEINKQENV